MKISMEVLIINKLDGLLCMPMVTNNWKGNEGIA